MTSGSRFAGLYGPPPICKWILRVSLDQSAVVSPAREHSLWPRWRSARPGPHTARSINRRGGWQVLGANLNCSESSRGADLFTLRLFDAFRPGPEVEAFQPDSESGCLPPNFDGAVRAREARRAVRLHREGPGLASLARAHHPGHRRRLGGHPE